MKKDQLKPEEKSAIEKKYKGIVEQAYSDLCEIRNIYKSCIPGVVGKIRNPVYETANGSTEDEYIYDFPSFYQVESVHYLLNKKRVLIADEMGLGKTAQAVAGMAAIEDKTKQKCKTLVVCPTTVKDQWYEKITNPINGYLNEDYVKNITVTKLDSYTSSALEELKNSDIGIISYDALSFGGNGNVENGQKKTNREMLKKILIENGFRYMILDEAHNAKNPAAQAYRSKHVKDIADNAEYLAMLTGTPIPNTLSDIYMMIALLEPKRKEMIDGVEKETGYENAREVASIYSRRPGLIRAVLNMHMIRREAKDVHELPELDDPEDYYPVELNQEQSIIYNDILENCELEGSYKLEQLKKALLDPVLVDAEILDPENRNLVNKAASSKYVKLEEMIKENIYHGEKTIVFSPIFRNGVTEKLESMLSKYGTLRMDGENRNDRKSIHEKFQTDISYNVLIATDVAAEGIPLTAANNVILLDDPYSPGDRDQMIKRSHRPGQTKKVKVRSLRVKDTVDQGVAELLAEKKEAIDFILKGLPLSEHYKLMLSRYEYDFHTPIGNHMYTPEQKARIYTNRMSVRLSGKDEKMVIKALDGPIGEKYAENFFTGYEKGYQQNIARAYKQIIQTIEEKEGKKNKIDIGSAFGVLAHEMNDKGVVSMDMNRHHFKRKTADMNVQANMVDIPFKNESFDIAVSSLCLHYASNNGRRRQAIQEANRILKNGGYYLLIENVSSIKDQKNFNNGLRQSGFEIVPELSGNVKSTHPKNIGLKTNIIVAKKKAKPNEADNSCFRMSLDESGRDTKRGFRKNGVVEEFAYYDLETRKETPLTERIDEYFRK